MPDQTAHSRRRTRDGELAAAPERRGGVTSLRCGGCATTALLAQRGQGYGRLVHLFLERHEPCGNAVEITSVTGSDGA